MGNGSSAEVGITRLNCGMLPAKPLEFVDDLQRPGVKRLSSTPPSHSRGVHPRRQAQPLLKPITLGPAVSVETALSDRCPAPPLITMEVGEKEVREEVRDFE